MKYLLICAFVLGSIAPAHAYIDGGSGSFFLQSAIAGIVALAFTFKLYWRRMRVFFASLSGRTPPKDTHTGG